MPGIYDSFGFLFIKAHQDLKALIQPTLKAEGLTLKHLGLILIVREFPGINQKNAGEIQKIDRTTMTKLVDFLEKKELIQRIPNPHNRRCHGLFLTDVGETSAKRLWQAVESAQGIFFSKMDEKQIKELKNMLLLLVKEDKK